MFMSVGQLETQMGVNKTIGRFFVNRKPPQDNIFWRNKLLYVSFGNGYLSIPVYSDILHRIGISLDAILNEEHIIFMEQIMHFAHTQEKNGISKHDELKSIRAMLNGRIQNPIFYERLCKYLDQPMLKSMEYFGTNYPALNRADAFLFVLCDLPLSESQLILALRYWYALLPSYLIADDIRDYARDKEGKEENVIIDLGDGIQGFEESFKILKKNSKILVEINPLMAQVLLSYEDDLRKCIPVNI
jgi:hypothetical protein